MLFRSRLTVGGKPVFVLSMGSPMGQGLAGKVAGDQAAVNGRSIQIEQVW